MQAHWPALWLAIFTSMQICALGAVQHNRSDSEAIQQVRQNCKRILGSSAARRADGDNRQAAEKRQRLLCSHSF